MNRYSINVLISSIFIIMISSAVAAESRENTLEYTQTGSQKLQEEKIRQKQWSLSKTDWDRYKKLMMGIRGSISPKNISPIEVLGTHARSDAERRKYAELWARMRHDDIEKILAFQQAYNVAFAKLYPNQQMIDTRLLGLDQSSDRSHKQADRLLVFFKTTQCKECKTVFQQIMSNDAINTLHIDIYFTDTTSKADDNKIRSWAKAQNIDNQRLKAGSITLNHDNGSLSRITKTLINPIPQVFSINSKKIERIKF